MQQGRLFGLTPALKRWMENAMTNMGPQEKDNYLRKTIKRLTEQKKEFLRKYRRGPDRARGVHGEIDEVLVQSRIEDPYLHSMVTCRKGCNHCCHMQVMITDDDADLLADIVKSGKVSIDMDALKRQAAYPVDEMFWIKIPKADAKCVFLGDDGLCKVYDDRPTECRKYMVSSPPERCGTRYEVDQVALMVDERIELLASAAMNCDKDLPNANKTLPQKLLERLEC